MSLAELIGYAAAACVFLTFYMKTMVPLRLAGIASNVLFIVYGYFSGAHPVLILHLALLPLNIWRLREMQQLMQQMKEATHGDLNMEWLKPFMTKRNFKAGDILFHKGDVANAMYYTVTGKFLVKEVNVILPPGRVMGELGFLSPDNKRTATVECLEDGQVLFIIYDKVRELYFQDPDFGFYFLKLTSERLLQNIARLEGELEKSKARIRELEAAQIT